MNATFEAVGALRIDDRRFAIYGNILTGELTRGQSVAIPFNGSVSMTLKIDSIEYMDRLQDRTAYVALTFHKLDDETVELLESFNIGGETLDINA